jgi:hypothetical protein
MIKINIKEFITYNQETIYEFLCLQSETEFEITIPRIGIAQEDEDFMVSFDYRDAAYAGFLISRISDSFAYYIPAPEKNEPFHFKVTITDMEKFAATINLISHGLSNLPVNRELFYTFQNASAAFLADSDIADIHCKVYGLLHIADIFLSDENLSDS